MSVIHTLLEGIIDYAGLFPPAGLPLETAVGNYASYRTGEAAWALGRFIVPVAGLDAFGRALYALPPRGAPDEPWRLSALASDDLERDVAAVLAFNRRRWGDIAGARIEAIELKVHSTAEIAAAIEVLPPTLERFLEIPIGSDPRQLIAALAEAGACAKVRTGGTTADAFPQPPALLRCVAACVEAGVPFKATAGLHHPLRSIQPLTYEPGSEHGLMFGFLNVFLSAALLKAGASTDAAAALLTEADPAALRFEADSVVWRSHELSRSDLACARRDTARSFGSCSFVEPINDLKAMHLL